MSLLEQALGSLTYGVASAWVPILNAEAFALFSGVTGEHTGSVAAVLVVVALALGQTVGKLALFEAARRGADRFTGRFKVRAGSRAARWAARIDRTLATRRTGVPLVLTSAALGLPPLAAVSLAAGVSGQRRWEFAAACLIGRTARFAALVIPASLAMA